MKISLKEAAEKIFDAQSFIITAHVNPDGDALGSCLGMMHILKSFGKDVTVLIDDDLPKNFEILSGFECIQRPEADSYTADYLLLLDASLDRCGKVLEKCSGIPVLNIDHHISNDEKANFLCLDAKAAACAEIVYRLAVEMGVEFTQDIAINLYTGIATDCGYFRYSNTTPFTMQAAAEMLKTGIRPEKISEALETRSYDNVKALAAAMQTIEIAENGKVAGVYLPYDIASGMESTEGFIDSVRIIEGVDVAVLLKEKEPSLCRVSMRSKATDVSAIAQSLGGGGHIRAAGCTIKKPFEEAKSVILAAIHEAMA